MPIDRNSWKPPFGNGLPTLPCCRCTTGFLHVVPDSLKEIETGPSENERSHDAWEPEWMDARFTGFCRCTNPKCRHVVAVTGKVGFSSAYEDLPDGSWELTTNSHYTPLALRGSAANHSSLRGMPGGCFRTLEPLIWAVLDGSALLRDCDSDGSRGAVG